MRALVVALIICASAAVLYCPAFAAVDLVNGSANQTETQIGFYSPDSFGNMAGVREFDGRTLSVASLEYLRSVGYSGPWQYSTVGNYLFAHDMDALVNLNYKNRFGLSYGTSTLTHRLLAIRAGDIVLVGSPSGVDDNPSQQFAIVRKVDEANMRFMDSSQSLRFVVDAWQQSKDGTRQQLGRYKATPTSSNIKHATAVPVDNDTKQTTVGTDVRVGTAVINYRFSDTKFAEAGTGITSIPLLKNLTQIGSDTKASTVKARAAIGDRLYFTGFYVTRQRSNTRATFTESHPTSMSTSAGTAALTYMATDSLTLTARYRRTDQDSETVPILSSGSTINSALSTMMNSSSVEATYSGIRHAFLKAGYEHKAVSRSTQLTSTPLAELEPSSKADIVTGSIRYYPTTNLSIFANALINNTDTAGYAGTPNKQKQFNANATYMLGDNLAVYGDFSNISENNDLINIPLADIPATGETRKDAAGQGYDNKMTTTTVGTWYAFNSKLVADANYSRISTDASNLWILGLDATTAASNTVPNMVSFSTLNNQYSTGLTYSMTPRLSFYGRYALSNSSGSGLLDPADYPPGVGPTWLPVSLREHTYTLGFSDNLTNRDRLMLDFSVSEYVDQLNAANTGSFDIWRLAWSHQF